MWNKRNPSEGSLSLSKHEFPHPNRDTVCYCMVACDPLLQVLGCWYPFPILSSNIVHKREQKNKQTKTFTEAFAIRWYKMGCKIQASLCAWKKIKPNSISSTIATPQRSQQCTHRNQDLEGAVHDFDVPILQGTAYHRDVGMAIQPFDARHWSLLPYTARTIFTPPWLVPGDVESQEFTVLKRKVAKRSPFTIRVSDMLPDGGHIKKKINGKPKVSKIPTLKKW